MNFPPRAGRVSGWATTPALRHAPRAKLQRTNPGSNPLSLRGILFKRSGPALTSIAGDTFEEASTIVSTRILRPSNSWSERKSIAQTSLGAVGARRFSRSFAATLRFGRLCRICRPIST